MEKLAAKYKKTLDAISASIQESDELAAYLESEEVDDYKALIERFEGEFQDLYLEVANEDPLQLLALEKEMLDPMLEGLYLPKIVGYSVLRGEVNENYKYRKPQDHFKEVLLACANSSNFEMIKMRVGLSLQIGFALSSDIWITNIIESVKNSKVKYFLQSQKIDKYRDIVSRKIGLEKYRKQFESLNYHTVDFPNTATDLVSDYHSLKSFLIFRGKSGLDNSSFSKNLNAFIKNDALRNEGEYLKILLKIGLYFDLDAEGQKYFAEAFDYMKKHNKDLTEDYFNAIKEISDSHEMKITPEADKRLSKLIAGKATKDVNDYYDLMNTIHDKGFVHEDALESVQNYYSNHEGLSVNNECLRAGLLNYFTQLMENLPEEAYHDYFEINKTFVQYINIFGNQKFNQAIKDLSMNYVHKLMKEYTDKRGRDYQDIKKFVSTTFVDLGFLKEKEIQELFKTKRKKKAE